MPSSDLNTLSLPPNVACVSVTLPFHTHTGSRCVKVTPVYLSHGEKMVYGVRSSDH